MGNIVISGDWYKEGTMGYVGDEEDERSVGWEMGWEDGSTGGSGSGFGSMTPSVGSEREETEGLFCTKGVTEASVRLGVQVNSVTVTTETILGCDPKKIERGEGDALSTKRGAAKV
jgi:hypothetical protein